VDTAFAVALIGVSWWWRNRGVSSTRRSETAGGTQRLPLRSSVKAVVYEQLGSPGAWVAGVRTVDRRTGRRVALWRTVLIASARLGTQAAAKRLAKPSPPISEAEHAERARALQAIRERFPDDEDARNAALTDHYREHQVTVKANLGTPLAISIGSSLLNSRLRRHLAPTMLVRRPREAHPVDHSP
jgi:hypothetical protein